MRRIVVIGGSGFFGSVAVELLKAEGFDPVIVSKRSGFDVENSDLIRSFLKKGDVVLDSAGPFQKRSTTLVKIADEMEFDVVDISDSLDYSEKIYTLKPTRAKILTSCSTLSVFPASFISLSGIQKPLRVSTFLAPELHVSANPGAGNSLLYSIGLTIRVYSEGRLKKVKGWSLRKHFSAPPPIGFLNGYLCETADAVTLPMVWPSLTNIEFWVDTRIGLLNKFFSISSKLGVNPILKLVFIQKLSFPFIRVLSPKGGAVCLVIEGETKRKSFVIVAEHGGYYAAVIPAVMATKKIAEGKFNGKGIIPVNQYVNPMEFLDYLRKMGLKVFCSNQNEPFKFEPLNVP